MVEIISSAIIAAIICGYAGFIICRRVKKFKDGKCDGCAGIKECEKFKQG